LALECVDPYQFLINYTSKESKNALPSAGVGKRDISRRHHLPLALEHLVADAGVSIPKALIFVFLTYVGKCPSVHDGNEYI
jgi:ABC-type dipeptide/oligopeptide/nickel transport system permease subunit